MRQHGSSLVEVWDGGRTCLASLDQPAPESRARHRNRARPPRRAPCCVASRSLCHRSPPSFFFLWPATRRAIGSSKDRKSTRLNSSHLVISYAVFCLKKKITIQSPS